MYFSEEWIGWKRLLLLNITLRIGVYGEPTENLNGLACDRWVDEATRVGSCREVLRLPWPYSDSLGREENELPSLGPHSALS